MQNYRACPRLCEDPVAGLVLAAVTSGARRAVFRCTGPETC
jgi:hypothetical protein